jgi:hypothetical protein
MRPSTITINHRPYGVAAAHGGGNCGNCAGGCNSGCGGSCAHSAK